jgi:anti-anti-sigma factor
MGDPLTIEVRREQDYVIVTAAGEIDISTVTRMRECLFELAASGRPLVADLDQVSFIDSTGLAALVGTPSVLPPAAAACTRSAAGRRSASCSALPGWTAGYR